MIHAMRFCTYIPSCTYTRSRISTVANIAGRLIGSQPVKIFGKQRKFQDLTISSVDGHVTHGQFSNQ